jgi:hypothetical protein
VHAQYSAELPSFAVVVACTVLVFVVVGYRKLRAKQV